MKKSIILGVLFCSSLMLANDYIQDEGGNERGISTSARITRTANSENFSDNELMIDYENNKSR